MSDSKVHNTHPVVEAKGITKSFKIPLERSSGLKQKLVNILKGRRGYRIFTPLENISFTVNEGDFFGIVGKNGSGKSTLLKTIAGIYSPQHGSISVSGSLVPFIELGVGFNPELSGRENVFLNGALLGFNRQEIRAMYDDIVEFAELGEFMDERLKNYSSGMQVRLAFSIAIKAQGDVLLLDEVLAVGDAAFQQKCFDYFEQLKRDKKTIIIVTHDMNAVKRFCNRAILIKNGHIEKIGSPEDIAALYTEENIDNSGSSEDPSERYMHPAFPSKIQYDPKDTVSFTVTAKNLQDECFVNVSLVFNGFVIADRNSKYNSPDQQISNTTALTFSQPLSNLNSGKYDIHLSLHRIMDDRLIEHRARAYSFVIKGKDPSRDGPVRLSGEWSNKSSGGNR